MGAVITPITGLAERLLFASCISASLQAEVNITPLLTCYPFAYYHYSASLYFRSNRATGACPTITRVASLVRCPNHSSRKLFDEP
jgi:hypothetical protein